MFRQLLTPVGCQAGRRNTPRRTSTATIGRIATRNESPRLSGDRLGRTQGIAMAATLAYGSNLIGPPIFGAVASVSSLRAAFAMLLPVSLAILALACVQRRRLSSDV